MIPGYHRIDELKYMRLSEPSNFYFPASGNPCSFVVTPQVNVSCVWHAPLWLHHTNTARRPQRFGSLPFNIYVLHSAASSYSDSHVCKFSKRDPYASILIQGEWTLLLHLPLSTICLTTKKVVTTPLPTLTVNEE